MNKIYVQTYHSPCGEMLIGSYDDKLCLADWTLEKHRELIARRLRKELKAETVEESTPIIEKTIKELNDSAAGRHRFPEDGLEGTSIYSLRQDGFL